MPLKKIPSADIKRKTRRYFEVSLVLSLACIVAAFTFFPEVSKKAHIMETSQEIIKIDDIANTRQESKPPPPPRPPIPIEATDAESLPDIEIGELLPEENVLPPAPPVVQHATTVEPEEEFFEVVEVLPEIVGGLESLQKTLEYPELAIRAGIEGAVVILAYVDKTGRVAKAEVVRGIGGGCDEEALSKVLVARFKPGEQRGVPVAARVSVRLRFALTNR